MKHFGHDCDALDDVRINDLMAEHGLAGYGFYFSCLELIGQKIKTNNVTCELQHSVKSLAFKFRTDLGLTQAYLSTCLDLGLFWKDDRTDKIYCFKILSRIEKNVAQNPGFKQLLAIFENSELYKYYLSTKSVLTQSLVSTNIVPNEVSSKTKELENEDKKAVKQLSNPLASPLGDETPKPNGDLIKSPTDNGHNEKLIESLQQQLKKANTFNDQFEIKQKIKKLQGDDW